MCFLITLILLFESKINFISINMENFETGLMLMGIGMTTVFSILLIVIYLGKGLIILVNNFAPEEVKKIDSSALSHKTQNIPKGTLAAIIAAVSVTTLGKGKVTHVEKQ